MKTLCKATNCRELNEEGSSHCAAHGGVAKTLETRENTHGDFVTTAMIAQSLKLPISGCGRLSSVQAEALDMIATKIARILSGNPNEPDHWHDIAGYAQLVEKELRRGS